MRIPWTLMLVPMLACGQSSETNQAGAARIVEIKVPLNVLAMTEIRRAAVPGVSALKGVVALPARFDPRKSWPVLLVTAPSGASAVQSLGGYTNVALSQGWVVAAIDGPKVPTEK